MSASVACESVVVDQEFRQLIPPLTDEERASLEESILRDGCLDPLIVWREQGLLLDGHNRKEICDRYGVDYAVRQVCLPDRQTALRWVIEHQFGRRNLTLFQRAELALRLKPLLAVEAKQRKAQADDQARGQKKSSLDQNSDQENRTGTQLARVAGISHDTMARADYIVQHADEQTKEKLRRGETTINSVYKDLKKTEQKQERAARKEARPPVNGDRYRLILSDIAEAGKHIPAGSVDWIITDPPYPKEYLDLYDRLADLAIHALRPGGSLIAMVGQSYLPDILSRLSAKLTYHWTLAYLTPGGQAAQLWTRRVNTFWKPLLWFTKGDYDGDWMGDVCRSEGNDKRFHHWGQSESGMADIIERFTDPGETILDPFLGAGTTGVVAVGMGRRFIGLDIKPECVATASERLAAAAAEGRP